MSKLLLGLVNTRGGTGALCVPVMAPCKASARGALQLILVQRLRNEGTNSSPKTNNTSWVGPIHGPKCSSLITITIIIIIM